MEKINEILGYKKEVATLKSICDLLKNTEKYIKYGVKIPKGLLLYGEPGVGKTFMARALIEDSGRIPFYFSGNGEKGVRQIFKKAKKAGYSVIFFDDIDYLPDGKVCPEYQQLSYELDEIEYGEVFVIATAEKLENLPGYLKGEDCFDIKIELSSPEFDDACKIFELAFKDKNVEESFNIKDFCSFAEDWTYPMVERLINHAALAAVYEGNEKITMRHLVQAALNLNETPLAEKYDRETALHEAGHAAVHMLLGGKAACLILTEGEGYFKQKEFKDETYNDRERRYIVSVAGKACTELYYDASSLGASSDLQKVSEGLENDLSNLAVQGFVYYDAAKKLDCPEFNNKLAKSIQLNMQNYYDKARLLIEQNKPLVESIAEKLKEKHFLLSSELHKIYDDYLVSKQ